MSLTRKHALGLAFVTLLPGCTAAAVTAMLQTIFMVYFGASLVVLIALEALAKWLRGGTLAHTLLAVLAVAAPVALVTAFSMDPATAKLPHGSWSLFFMPRMADPGPGWFSMGLVAAHPIVAGFFLVWARHDNVEER